MVGRRKLPDPSLNHIFNALSVGVQYMLSLQLTNLFPTNDSSFSCCEEILFGVPQGWDHLFNAYICDHFFEVRDLEYTSFADDTTPHSSL